MILRQRRLTRQVRVQLQRNLELAARYSAAIPAALTAPPRSATATPGGFAERHDYRARRGRGAIVLPAVAVALAAAAAGYLATRAGGHAELIPAAASNQGVPGGPPTASVAVLNASRQPSAAANLARHLEGQRVHVIATGNVTRSRAPGYWILYAEGAKPQAEKLAAMLRPRMARIGVIDADARAAAGPMAKLVLVIA
ncbi:MAG: LytR C-terminal domain-containing protein [Solirubrobacterales bacterium]|nr:LytR C-terminal domain-containing protein [Solirubrobacterales bacterium]